MCEHGKSYIIKVVENEVFIMKVVFPMNGSKFTSTDVLPASCTSKPQIACTSIPKTSVNEGYSNKEIYEGIVSIKNHISSLFGVSQKQTRPINYLA